MCVGYDVSGNMMCVGNIMCVWGYDVRVDMMCVGDMMYVDMMCVRR